MNKKLAAADYLTGKTALVTGGSKRIGRAICLALANAGANVVVHFNRSAQEAEALAADIRKLGVQVWTVSADLSSEPEAAGLIGRACEQAGGLDILVNNASIFDESRFETFTFEELSENIRVNAWAPMTLARELVNRGSTGHIINLLDTRVVGYDWAHVAYHASKVLLERFTRMMAIRYAPRFQVNAICPGLILPPPGKGPEHLESLKDRLPLKRVGSADEIADAVLFLVRSDFITGQTIFVDGGRHLREGENG